MSTKHTSKCLQKAADDEPIFVLRAQDKTAATLIRIWVAINNDTNPFISADKLKSALQVADEMEQYNCKRKFPD